MPLTSGQSLSFYEILAPLGVGGMGEVYLARDTRLEREVAIKVLPEELADDDERLRRFEREAKTLASLNHPNVAGIHGIDQEQDTCFLAMELVPGEDLEARLKRGALPVDEALDVCRQIAEGLEAAHEAGVIHRDLKPANVRVTPEGIVKILDFGLAKPIHPKARREGTSAAESDSFLMTEEGLVLGTPTYMSPEQARGKLVDRRTDVWAFGCVLFECLTGKRAFGGESLTDILAAIVTDEPDWSLVPALPQRAIEVLRRCLEKEPRTRLRDIGEARVRLEREDDLELASDSNVRTGKGSTLIALAVGVLVGATALWMAGGDAPEVPVSPDRAVFLSLPASTLAYHSLSNATISPDGRSVVFNATRVADDVRMIWLRSLDSADAKPLPETEDGRRMFWSPDGTAIGFTQNGGHYLLRLNDSVPNKLPLEREFIGATWSSSGWIVYAEREGPLWKISERGGDSMQITVIDHERGEFGHSKPTFLPDGDRFLFLIAIRQGDTLEPKHLLCASSLSDPKVTELGGLASVPYYTDRGELVFAEDGRVRSVPFDAETLTITGAPETLADGVNYFQPVGEAMLSVSKRGDVVFGERGKGLEMAWVDKGGRQVNSVLADFYARGARLSPDGQSVAVGKSDPRTSLTDIWIYGTERGTVRRLTSHPSFEGSPVWSHDGRSIYYMADAHGRYPDVMRIDLDSPGEPSVVWDPEGSQTPIDATHAGDKLLVSSSGESYWLVPLDGSGEPQEIEELRGAGDTLRFSPDDQWIAFWSQTSGEAQVYVHELGGKGRTIQVTVEGGADPAWDPQGRKLYFTRNNEQVWEVDLTTEEQLANPRPEILFESSRRIGNIEVSPDGERFLVRYISRETPATHVLLR